MATKLNPIVESLPEYVEQNKSDLITAAVLGGKTMGLFNLMVGVNGPTALNLLQTDIVYGDGTVCGFNPETEQTLSQRVLTPTIVKVNAEYCPKLLLPTYLAHQVRIGAGRENLPYEAKFIGDIVDRIKADVDATILLGEDSGRGIAGGNILNILKDDGAVHVTASTTDTRALVAIKDLYAALPEKTLQKDDVAILVPSAMYRAAVQEMIDDSHYHYIENDSKDFFYLPGTNVKVYNTPGITALANDNDSYSAFAMSLSNVYVGVDMANDMEEFDFWFSKDNDTFRLKIEFAVGVQIAFPDECAYLSGWKQA